CTLTHSTWGGIENWLSGLVEYLRGNDWDVIVGLARGRKFNNPEAFRRHYPHFNTIEIDGRSGTKVGRVRAVTRVIRHVRPDVVMPLGLADVYRSVADLKMSQFPVRLAVAIHATNIEHHKDIIGVEPIIDLCVGGNPLHDHFLQSHAPFPPGRLG